MPSAGAARTASIATRTKPPGLFSTSTGWPSRGEPLGHQARDEVHRAAGGEADHEPHRLRDLVLRKHRRCAERQRDEEQTHHRFPTTARRQPARRARPGPWQRARRRSAPARSDQLAIATDHRADEMLLQHRAEHHAENRGRTGKPFSSMKYAMSPNASISTTPNTELLIANEPTMQKSRITGISTWRGARKSCFALLMAAMPSGRSSRFARMNTMKMA